MQSKCDFTPNNGRNLFFHVFFTIISRSFHRDFFTIASYNHCNRYECSAFSFFNFRKVTKIRVKLVEKKINIKRLFNLINVFISILVFGTGLVLFTQFHIGDGAYQKEWYGVGKNIWLAIHQISAIGFLIGFGVHMQMHWKYFKKVAKRWQINLPKKTKSRTLIQILFLIVTSVVLWAGFYPWIAMPGATLEVEVFHNWIDVHNRVGIFYLIGMIVHTTKRRRRIFKITKKNIILNLKTFRNPAN